MKQEKWFKKIKLDILNSMKKNLKGGPMCTFELDDIIYIKSLTPTTSFMPKHLGPYVVIRKIRNDNYVIRDANDEIAKTIELYV